MFFPHCRRRCRDPGDVASVSRALISGAHENMPLRVVDDRVAVFLSFTSSQVVNANDKRLLENDKENSSHT